ncbi:ATP-binding protein [Bailinhaonella thermotolerans]|uniref:LuxR family transcriptional regulator n=1 Tax=Bailinhaonella thermotolerans TaxID=1070861 RepID=A0A3A4BKA9_9ACTN|nr:LuxR family transcriptional regulator [Bailinhaonella thermotolerans]RJL31592.1 LuxR family transcriptional regulator [Bailinhaonella thermotolerans]
MQLIERAEALANFHSLIEKARRGVGGVMVITGPGAMGKSALLQACANDAAAAGFFLMKSAGSRAERMFPLGTLGQLFRSAELPQELTDEVEQTLVPEPVNGISGVPDPVVLGQNLTHVAARLCGVLVELTKRQPILLAVDDVHYADGPSLQALLYIQRRMANAPLLLAVTSLSQRRSVNSLFSAELTRQPNCVQVRVTGLSQGGVEELLRDAVGAEPAVRLAPEYHRLSGGNPLLLHAMVQDYWDVAQGGWSPEGCQPGVGRHLHQAVLSCLHRWDPRVLDAARGVALLGRSASTGSVAQLLGVKPAYVLPALEALDWAGLLRANQFRHPTMRKAVLRDLSPDRQSVMHMRAARIMYQLGAEAGDIAEHLLTASPATPAEGEPWMVAVLREAAQAALVHDDPDRTISCLELARRICDDEPARAAILTELARANWCHRPAAALRFLAPLEDAFGRGRLADADARALSRYLLWHGRIRRASRVYDWTAPSRDTPPRGKDRLCLTREWVRLIFPSLFVEGEAGEPAGGGDAREFALRNVLLGKAEEDVVGAAQELLESCNLAEAELEAVVGALFTLAHAGRRQEAVRWCESLGTEGAARGFPRWTAALAGIRSWLAVQNGELGDARRYARQALSGMSRTGWGVVLGLPLTVLLRATVAMGDLDEAAEIIKRGIPDDLPHTTLWPLFLQARGEYYLATDRTRAALSDFHECGELLRAWDLDIPALADWRCAVARMYLRIGAVEEARQKITEQLSMPGGTHPRVRGRALRLLASVTELRQRPARLQEAMSLLQRSGDLLELGWAYADLSDAYQELGDITRARLMARRAKQIAKACEAGPLSARLQPREEDSGGGMGEVAALSDAERRVASLAAFGYTNREISQRLFITVSTVEQHLTRVYRKLNVKRRADLPTELSLGVRDSSKETYPV